MLRVVSLGRDPRSEPLDRVIQSTSMLLWEPRRSREGSNRRNCTSRGFAELARHFVLEELPSVSLQGLETRLDRAGGHGVSHWAP